MAEELFNAMEEQTQEQVPNTIKLGEDEYTQEDLQRLVGLGKIGAEAEEKYGVKIDKIWPNHQRTINEKLELEQRIKTLEETRTSAQSTPEQLNEEQIASAAREQLSKLGYLPATDVQKMVNDTVQGYRLLDNIQSTINTQVESGYPATTPEELLQFMSDPSNPKDPVKAYKMMFEDQIDRIKEQKLSTLRPSQFVTTSSSTAGSKEPAPQKVTSKNLGDALRAVLPD